MINTLYLPELREMLAANDEVELREFCGALHPSRTADFMEGLSGDETWRVLRYAEESTRVMVFEYLPLAKQREIIETQDRVEIARLVSQLTSDERVDILQECDAEVVRQLLPLLPAEDRRDILRLSQYPEGTAGSVMATEFVALPETLTIRQAMDEIARQADQYETMYYIYIVDEIGHLHGVVTARVLLSQLRVPTTTLAEIMNPSLITVNVGDQLSDVVNKVAKLDLLAIPVVDHEGRIMGIITFDDVIDLVREEATDDAYRAAAVAPLEEPYLQTNVWTIGWKRGVWLAVLLCFSLITAYSLRIYEARLETWVWLVAFIPLIISSGGNSGNQSATLIITALSQGQAKLRDWLRIFVREIAVGLILGVELALIGFVITTFLIGGPTGWVEPLVVPLTLMLVVLFGSLLGSMLPLLFKALGLDPALMSNPFVAGTCDIVGIFVYMNVALWILT